jgi:hypothetical protein
MWTPARRIAVSMHLASLDTAYGRLAAQRLATSADAYAARWIATHRTGCLAHQRGELSAEAYDRRQSCLASARTQLGALLELGSSAAPDKAETVVRAIPELPDLAHCEDVEALSAVPPPTQAQTARSARLRERLDRARVRLQGGADDLEPELVALVGEARALSYSPLLADALLAQGTYYLQQWKFAQAEEPLRLAHAEALRSRDYRGAVESFARLAWALSKREDAPPTQALEGLAVIGPLAEGLPAHARFAQSLLHNNLGGIALAAGDLSRARNEYETAIGLARDVIGPGAIELSAALQGLALISDDEQQRERLFGQRIALLERELGEAHPLTLTTQNAAALTRAAPSDALARLTPPCHQLAALHPTRGAAVAACAYELGWLDLELAKLEDAKRDFALAMRAEPDGSVSRAAAAYLAMLSNDRPAAEQQFRALIGTSTVDDASPWYARFHAATLELGLGLSAESAGDHAEARKAFLRARAHLEAADRVHRWAPMSWRLAWLDRRLR